MDEPLRLRSASGRWVLAAAILGSGMAMLDGTVVNVALRVIGRDLDASLSDLQWVVSAYALFLASLILIGGSLSDRFGRRRIFVIGVVWFGLLSVACAAAQDIGQLIAARALQGVGAALLTPGSLAMLQASFDHRDRSRAIGVWSGLGGIAAAIGPLLGGWLVQSVGWPWVFWINAPVAVAVVAICLRHVPESRDVDSVGRFDVAGAVFGAVGLAGVTYATIQSSVSAPSTVAAAAVVGAVGLVAFVVVERRIRHPMVPPSLFGSRVFSGANALTLLVYGALGALLFLLVLQLQVVAGYPPLEAGLATLPITVVMLLLSPYSGSLSTRIGPRLQMSAGPLVCAAGTLLLLRVGAGSSYAVDVLPGITVFALGLVCLVAPLTATVLAAAPDRYAGTASGVNNAVARAGSLLAVSALPVAVGLSGNDYQQPAAFDGGFRLAVYVCAALLAAGGLLGAATITNPVPETVR